MNRLSKLIMEELGLEVEQEFILNSIDETYKFNDKYELVLEIYENKFVRSELTLNALGECLEKGITKSRRKPKMGESYYIPDPAECHFYSHYKWDGCYMDEMVFKRGLVFFTKEDAITKAKQMIGMEE